MRKNLLQLSHSLGLQDQVRFRGFQADVRDHLSCYRAYAHASYSESSSFAIIEAMAAGLPILAGNIGPISELCMNGVEARYWSLTDPVAAATTVIELLDQESARRALASASAERFRRQFDARIIGPRLVDFLLHDITSRSELRLPISRS
jgi:glycosyltransferase involved in cell wall biosynthesis